jgi:hypothetical protein
MMEAKRYSETSVLTRATRFQIPEDGILHGHLSENMKSYQSFRDGYEKGRMQKFALAKDQFVADGRYYILDCLKEGPILWSSGQTSWLHTQRSRVRFPALPDFLSSSRSGTGSTQPL